MIAASGLSRVLDGIAMSSGLKKALSFRAMELALVDTPVPRSSTDLSRRLLR